MKLLILCVVIYLCIRLCIFCSGGFWWFVQVFFIGLLLLLWIRWMQLMGVMRCFFWVQVFIVVFSFFYVGFIGWRVLIYGVGICFVGGCYRFVKVNFVIFVFWSFFFIVRIIDQGMGKFLLLFLGVGRVGILGIWGFLYGQERGDRWQIFLGYIDLNIDIYVFRCIFVSVVISVLVSFNIEEYFQCFVFSSV